MASFSPLQIALFFTLLASSLATRQLAESTQTDSSSSMAFEYHKGPLLSGRFTVNLLWYGSFKPAQRAIITDFLASLSSSRLQSQPSVATWWGSVGKYYRIASPRRPSSLTISDGLRGYAGGATAYPCRDLVFTAGGLSRSGLYCRVCSSPAQGGATTVYARRALLEKILDPSLLTISLGKQLSDATYSLGKSLSITQIQALATKGKGVGQVNAVTVVLTASDVAVDGFCMSRCGTHGLAGKSPYIWVGNSEVQCPGQCAWPFHQPIYGPQGPPLVAPNNDVGLDGMVINLATLLAGTATNPYGNGFYQGPKEAPLEAASACPGVYGKGAYPGYAGQLLVDPRSGASYNANGVNGRKYLVPALYDPSTSTCSTIV